MSEDRFVEKEGGMCEDRFASTERSAPLTMGERVDRAIRIEREKNAKLLLEIRSLKEQLALAKSGNKRIGKLCR